MHFCITLNAVTSTWVIMLSLSVKIWARKRSKQWSTGRQIQFLWNGCGKNGLFVPAVLLKGCTVFVFKNVSKAVKVTSNEISQWKYVKWTQQSSTWEANSHKTVGILQDMKVQYCVHYSLPLTVNSAQYNQSQTLGWSCRPNVMFWL